MKILHIDTSIMEDGSVTRELTGLVIDRLCSIDAKSEVIYRDLVKAELPHLTRMSLPSSHRLALDNEDLDEAGRHARAQSDAVLAEFLDAECVVIGAPMYNFTVPSQLKSWLDRILVAGFTFRYTSDGPEGLAGGKRIIVAVARGGFYGRDSGEISAEHAEHYLRSVFGFIGVTNPEFIIADGLGRGEHNRARALAAARDAIGQLNG